MKPTGQCYSKDSHLKLVTNYDDSKLHFKKVSVSSIPRPMGPIEEKMRKTLSTLKGSKYPDTFDWGLYDRIYEKLGDKAPYHGVIFKTTLRLVNHHESCSKCHYSLEIDSYGRGCFHNCNYCYAKDQLERHGVWNKPQPFPVDLAEVRKIFYTVFETKKKSKWREILESRTPIRVGSMSDSFMWLDTKYGVTKELLKIFNFYNYPHIIFTRSDLVAHDDYMELLNKDLCAIQMSISGNNHRLTRIIEPGAPSYKRRLQALKKLSEAGYWTTVRVNPLFAKYPDGYFTDPESIASRFGSRENVPVLDLYNDDFMPELAEAKVPSVLAGFVRLSHVTIKNMSKVTGVDFKEFYKPELFQLKGDKRYSDKEIAYYYKDFLNKATRAGIRFNTCYIGNGLKDFFQYQGMWSNKEKDCCDVLGNIAAFKKTSQTIPWETRRTHSPCKENADRNRLAEEAMTNEFERTGKVTFPEHRI